MIGEEKRGSVVVDEVLKIKNTAEAARVYALQANDDELVNNADEVKLRREVASRCDVGGREESR